MNILDFFICMVISAEMTWEMNYAFILLLSHHIHFQRYSLLWYGCKQWQHIKWIANAVHLHCNWINKGSAKEFNQGYSVLNNKDRMQHDPIWVTQMTFMWLVLGLKVLRVILGNFLGKERVLSILMNQSYGFFGMTKTDSLSERFLEWKHGDFFPSIRWI